MRVWEEAPFSMRAYAVLSVAWQVVGLSVSPKPFLTAVFGLFGLVILYFLLRGLRWLWFVTIGVVVLGLLTDPFVYPGIHWWTYPLNVVALVLLLLPDSRRHFARPAPAPASS